MHELLVRIAAYLGSLQTRHAVVGAPCRRPQSTVLVAEQALSLITERGCTRGRDLTAMFTRLRGELKSWRTPSWERACPTGSRAPR